MKDWILDRFSTLLIGLDVVNSPNQQHFMGNYNYHFLSPTEFEELARDLVQRRDQIILETFKEGKDQGIDLRYAKTATNTLIVQAKRFKDDYPYLFGKLKDPELAKVKKLAPRRYILVTSVGLTPKNKTEIKKLFSPYIKKTDDIIGRDDLDNLLGLYHDLEKKHYKLWITSTHIMQQVLHGKEHQQSSFELDTITQDLKFYVQHEGFQQAKAILDKERFLVISGIPGIGKTTLARMLALDQLSSGNKEFIYVSGDIDEAFRLYRKDAEQVYLFDDFLGQNFLSDRLSRNEDKRILQFIDQLRRDHNKSFILTTREYILRQAEQSYPALEELRRATKILEISSYTELVRAKILYNHLFFGEVPEAHLEDILHEQNYLKIINHPNYNPRIIGEIAKKELWKDIPADQFSKTLIDYLQHPLKVWENAFEHKISPLSRLLLSILALSEGPILEEDLFICASVYQQVDSLEFRTALRELEQTFISTKRDTFGKMGIEFQNPSIRDYLLGYLNTNRLTLNQLLAGISFIGQGFEVFEERSYQQNAMMYREFGFPAISHDSSSLKSVQSRIIQCPGTLGSSARVIFRTDKAGNGEWIKPSNRPWSEYCRILSHTDFASDEVFRKKLIDLISPIDLSDMPPDPDFGDLLYLRHQLDCLPANASQLITAICNKVESFSQLSVFCHLRTVYPAEFASFLADKASIEIKEKAMGFFREEFTKGIYPAIHPFANDFFTRTILKAEMERICEEINEASHNLEMGIYLDSDYHKEYVRTKLQALDKEDADERGVQEKEDELKKLVRELFNTLKPK